jgi:hypothetical protein
MKGSWRTLVAQAWEDVHKARDLYRLQYKSG